MFSHRSATRFRREGHEGAGVQVNDSSQRTIESTLLGHQQNVRSDEEINSDPRGVTPPCAVFDGSRTERLEINHLSQLKHRLTDATEAVVEAFNAHNRQRARRESTTSFSAQRFHSDFAQREKTDTGLTGHDVSYGRLQRKIYQEIKKNYCEETRAGFFPCSRLGKLLNIEALEKELARSDSFLEKRKKRLARLQFLFPKDGTRAKAIKAQALKILGDSSQRLRLTALESSKEATSTEPELGSEKTYLKIMAILIMIERPARIKLFIDEGVCDADLPLVLVTQSALNYSTLGELRKANARHIALKCFEGWSYSTVTRFEEWQWTFLSPSFGPAERKNVPHYRFSSRIILPFKMSKKSCAREGGFGWVRKVEIHPDHRTFHNESRRSFFAIKTLKDSRNEDLFKREVATLSRLSDDRHTHLISLLGTYEKDRLYNLIFPWAEADLLQYWKEKRNAKGHETLIWAAQQCQGIADGLSYIHRLETTSGKSLLHPNSLPFLTKEVLEAENIAQENTTLLSFCLFGIHGDIKPENILWFPHSKDSSHRGGGILKITDFGFAEFSGKENIKKSRCGFLAFTPTYCAPETQLENDFISSASDVWSLGCVYLEFIAWWLGGWSLIKEFEDWRLKPELTSTEWEGVKYKTDPFYSLKKNETTGHLDAEVKISVSKFIEDMKNHRRSNTFIKEFLEMIRTHMLIVERPGDRGIGSHRKSSANIARAIEKMRTGCHKGSD